MKKWTVSGFLFLIWLSSYSQNLDLVVTAKGDSIACEIDSISESAIYFKHKIHGSNKWMPTFYETENIVSYKYNCIDPSKFLFKKGTSIIISDIKQNKEYPKEFPDRAALEKASTDELDYYLKKARKTKKIGAIMSIAGPIAFGSGILLASSAWSGGTEAAWGAAIILGMVGTGSTIIGLPVFFTGTSRIKRINEIKKSKGMTVEFIPGGYYNHQAFSYQPGVTLRIRF